jgi:hypothetical protein
MQKRGEAIKPRKRRQRRGEMRQLSPRRREAGKKCCTTLMQTIAKIGAKRAMTNHIILCMNSRRTSKRIDGRGHM